MKTHSLENIKCPMDNTTREKRNKKFRTWCKNHRSRQREWVKKYIDKIKEFDPDKYNKYKFVNKERQKLFQHFKKYSKQLSEDYLKLYEKSKSKSDKENIIKEFRNYLYILKSIKKMAQEKISIKEQ